METDEKETDQEEAMLIQESEKLNEGEGTTTHDGNLHGEATPGNATNINNGETATEGTQEGDNRNINPQDEPAQGNYFDPTFI